MKLSIISAISDNNVIGKDNKLLWHLSNDLKKFKKLTLNKIVIMGKNTYDSLLIKPLPNRTNIIITNNLNLKYDKCIMAYNIEDSLKKSKAFYKESDEIFIIGGSSIYKQFINICDKLYITQVHSTFNSNIKFPNINENQWKITYKEKNLKDINNEYDYTYLIYEKI